MMKKERKKERKKEERKKKNKINPNAICMRFDFLTLSKVSGTLRVLLYLDSEVLLVHRLFALLLARLGARAPIPYVQDAILNLHHPYIVVATATTDNFVKIHMYVATCLCPF